MRVQEMYSRVKYLLHKNGNLYMFVSMHVQYMCLALPHVLKKKPGHNNILSWGNCFCICLGGETRTAVPSFA
jgi:hypothetical protein